MAQRKSALEEIHKQLGAGLDDWNGMDVAWSYATDPRDEHDTVREVAGLFDLSGLKKVWVTGRDALTVVDHVMTRDLSAIGVGQSVYGAVLTEEGTVTDDAIAFCLAQDRYLYVHGSGHSLELLQQSADGRDVEVRFDDDLHNLSLQGPRAVDLLAPHVSIELRPMKYFHHAETTLFDRDVLLSRTGYSGERGYEIFCRREDAVHLWKRILEAGQSEGVGPCSFTCLDKIRIEAGLLFYPYDMDERFTPWEVGLGWTLSKKGDYRGKEAAQAARGRERVRVVGVASDSAEPLDPEGVLLHEDREVGCVNSPAYSHRMQQSIALAHVSPGLDAPGTQLVHRTGTTEIPVTVERIPFHDPEKTRTHGQD